MSSAWLACVASLSAQVRCESSNETEKKGKKRKEGGRKGKKRVNQLASLCTALDAPFNWKISRLDCVLFLKTFQQR